VALANDPFEAYAKLVVNAGLGEGLRTVQASLVWEPALAEFHATFTPTISGHYLLHVLHGSSSNAFADFRDGDSYFDPDTWPDPFARPLLGAPSFLFLHEINKLTTSFSLSFLTSFSRFFLFRFAFQRLSAARGNLCPALPLLAVSVGGRVTGSAAGPEPLARGLRRDLPPQGA